MTSCSYCLTIARNLHQFSSAWSAAAFSIAAIFGVGTVKLDNREPSTPSACVDM
jgi:hypothetical protein